MQVLARGMTRKEADGASSWGTGWRVESTKVGDFMDPTCLRNESRQGAGVQGLDGTCCATAVILRAFELLDDGAMKSRIMLRRALGEEGGMWLMSPTSWIALVTLMRMQFVYKRTQHCLKRRLM
jgi:hypothetical protein